MTEFTFSLYLLFYLFIYFSVHVECLGRLSDIQNRLNQLHHIFGKSEGLSIIRSRILYLGSTFLLFSKVILATFARNNTMNFLNFAYINISFFLQIYVHATWKADIRLNLFAELSVVGIDRAKF